MYDTISDFYILDPEWREECLILQWRVFYLCIVYTGSSRKNLRILNIFQMLW